MKPTPKLLVLLFSGLAIPACAQLVNFSSAGDVTNNFREIRANANDMTHIGTAGSDGSTNGYAQFVTSADNGAVRYAYDANGATAGTSTFTTGFIALDITYSIDNKNFGLFIGSSNTDALGWLFRTNNGGTLENGSARFGINNTDNFTVGTTLTTSSGTAFTGPSGTPAFTTSTDSYSNVGPFAPGAWFSMRLDFGLDGSNQRTLQFRVWNNILDTGTGLGTGTLVWNQSLTISGTAYNGAVEVGMFTANNTSGAVSIDNVQLSAVPEPSTYAALAGACILGFAGFRRRRGV